MLNDSVLSTFTMFYPTEVMKHSPGEYVYYERFPAYVMTMVKEELLPPPAYRGDGVDAYHSSSTALYADGKVLLYQFSMYNLGGYYDLWTLNNQPIDFEVEYFKKGSHFHQAFGQLNQDGVLIVESITEFADSWTMNHYNYPTESVIIPVYDDMPYVSSVPYYESSYSMETVEYITAEAVYY